MKLLQTTAFCLAVALAAGPTFADGKAISELEVDVDLSDFADSNALEFYPNLETDIERAIAERIDLTDDRKDPRVKVYIHKIAVDGDTVLPDSMEFNEIEGNIVVFDGVPATESDNASDAGPKLSQVVKMVARTKDETVPEGWIVVTPSQEDFYQAMIDAFADYAADFLEENA